MIDNQNKESPTILIIDDDPGTCQTLTFILKEKGYIPSFVGSGKEAVEIVKAEYFNLALIDLKLPDMPGMKVLEEIKDISPDTEAVIITGYASVDTAVQAMHDAAFSYVIKPLDMDYLLAIISKALSKQKAETERRRAEEFIKSILESVGEGLCVVDREYRIVTANRAYAGQIDMPVEDIIGKRCHEISHWADRPCCETGMECPVKCTFGTGEPCSVTHTHRDKEGNFVYAEIKSYPMKDASGDVVSAIEVINDITEKRKLEDQLRHAQKMEAVGRLAGGVAHDFNNILTAIIGYGSILQMEMREDDLHRAEVDQILAAAGKAAHLTQHLLAFSRQQIINPRPENLNEVIERVGKLLLRLIGEDVELKMSLTDEDVTVLADSGQIEQILMNLATNARDAMPEGGMLSIRTELMELDNKFIRAHGYEVQPGAYAVFSVADTGLGMDENTKKRIFEPFYTTKEVGKGTGLGLSMIYGIVRQHNGYVNVYSEPGKGTIFRIYLPKVKSAIQEAKTEPLLPVRGGTETILLAEDDEAVRELTRIVLERSGYTVIDAVDGEDAVVRFKGNIDKIELVVLDVIMPKKDGKAAYEEIKKIRPEIKAIFLSGYTTDIIDRKGVLEQGINLIQKPVSPNDLLRKVREVLDG